MLKYTFQSLPYVLALGIPCELHLSCPQKMVERAFLADAKTLNFLGLGDVLCGYTIAIPHPAYSPDLAPSDYFLFLQLKKHLKGYHYDSDEEVVEAVRQWCREQSPEFFADGIRQLVRRWQLCVDRGGDYVEKINMRCVAEVSSFNLMYNLCMYYEKQKSYDKTELTFQPTLVNLE